MSINLLRLKKIDLHWLITHYCKCGHKYIEHMNCFEKDSPDTSPLREKIGFLDIESGGSLDADWGYLLSYCIKELDKKKIITNAITPEEVRDTKKRDKRLAKEFCQDIRPFDKIVVYYGKDSGFGRTNRHDIPFLRTRCCKWGIKNFPKWKEKAVVDVYDIIKSKFKLSRKSMWNACRLFGIPTKADPLNPDIWQDALSGKQSALDYILRHNIQDVISTELLWKAVIQYRGSQSTT